MIGTRQKKYLLDVVLKKHLQKGIVPSIQTLINEAGRKLVGKIWGTPTTTLRPAVRGTRVGGENGTDIYDTYTELADDTTVLYKEIVNSAEKALTHYQSFSSKHSFLRRRLQKINQNIERLLSFFSKGVRYTFYDTLVSTDSIDLLETTAELDLDEGAAILPRAISTLSPIDLSNTEIIETLLPQGIEQYGSFYDILTSFQNTAWQAVLNDNTYIATIRISNTLQTINGFYVDPLTSLNIKIEWSNDGFNFYSLLAGDINTPKTWSFDTIQANYFKIFITGQDVGIRQIKPLVINFANNAVVETITLNALDVSNTKVPIQMAEISVDTYLPKGTDIKAYITADDINLPQNWIRIDTNPVVLASILSQSIQLDKKDFVTIDASTPVPLYSSLIAGSNVLIGTEALTKGNRQFLVEYFNYTWNDEGDPNHVPSKADWDNRINALQGYFTPISTAATSDAISDGACMSVAKNMMCEVAEQTTGTAEWLVVGLLDGAGNTLLTSGGNYRFTSYIHTPSDMLLIEQPCLVYNPTVYGGTGSPVVAPFHIYLNDRSILYSKTSFTNLESVGINDYTATYSFKKGWNKLEIYMYFPGIGATDVDQTGLATSAVGLYFRPNILGFDTTSYKVQATYGYQKNISEFELKYSIPLGSKDYWAWASRLDPNSSWKVLLNFDLTQSSAVLDGINLPMKPVLHLNFNRSSEDMLNAIRLKFELSKTSEVNTTPKLYGYTLYLN